MTSLPPPLVIDFSKKDLKPGKNASQEELNSWRTTGEKVVGELKTHGCFMAKYDKLTECHKTLFKDDPSKKIIKKPNVSYELEFDNKMNPVLPDPLASTTEDMRNDILGYAQTAGVLLKDVVTEMVFDHYKLPKESTGYKFRMKKYKKEVILGCSDQEFLAVLDLNQVNGLETKTKDGKSFTIDVKPSTFLIMAGKPLMEWSKGNINPPEYRVKDEKEEKYWVGLFAYYDKGKIEVPKKLAGSSTPSYDDKKGKDKKKPVGSSCPP